MMTEFFIHIIGECDEACGPVFDKKPEYAGHFLCSTNAGCNIFCGRRRRAMAMALCNEGFSLLPPNPCGISLL